LRSFSRFSRLPIAPLAVAGALLATAACGGQPSAAPSSGSAKPAPPAPSASSAPIKVAIIGADSGQLASLGAWDYDGAKLAIDEVNAKGGIHGRKIEIVRLDDQGNPSVGVNDAKQAISDGVVAAFATPESTVALAVRPIFQKAKIPQMTAGVAPELTAPGDPYVFRDTAPSPIIDENLAAYVVDRLGLRKIAMICNNDAYGKGEHDGFLAALAKRGVKPVADETVTPDAKDFSGQLSRIAQTHPEALFIGAEEVETGLIAKQARALGLKAKLIGGQPMATPLYIRTAGAGVADGSIFSTPYINNDASAATRAFAAAYRKAFGQTAEAHGAKAYDGMRAIILAMEKAYPHVDGPHIAQALHAISFEGLQGRIRFTANGEGLNKTLIGTVQNGKAVPIK
jgi:branched-chain amino acid transport system substrate-binding protein